MKLAITFLTNIGNFGYYTIKLTDDLKFIIKPFTHEKNIENMFILIDQIRSFGLMEQIIYHCSLN